MERKIKNKIDVTKNKDTENHANSEINIMTPFCTWKEIWITRATWKKIMSNI